MRRPNGSDLGEWIAMNTVAEPGGCHVWTGSTTPHGYGKIKVDGRWPYVHRLAWELDRGPIPDGLVIDHICRNRRCCRVDHLRLVTQRQNVLENSVGFAAAFAARTECPQCGGPFTQRTDHPGRQCVPCKNAAQRARYAARRSFHVKLDSGSIDL